MEFEASTFNAVFGQNVLESDYFDYLCRMPRCWISSAAARFSRVTLLLPGRDTLPDDQEEMLSAAGWKNRQDIKTAGGLK